MEPTVTEDPEYFHKVVNCQYACPAHTPVPAYIRLIAAGRHTEAYMINWEANVFPGVLGRTCDRPCEPACRRGRIEKDEEPVAVCRLKRVCADLKGDVKSLMPEIPKKKNGRRVALIGGGPASLTVARDLMPLGYTCILFDNQKRGGGMMRSQIPSFRLPEKVLDEEVGYITDMGVDAHFNQDVTSMKEMLARDFDAVFVGTGAPRGRDLDIPGRQEADKQIHIGIDWLASVAFGHIASIGKRVIVLGGGNTAMDCCRTARRLGGEDVRVVVRSPFKDMKASPWEREDAEAEDIPMFENHVPKEFKMKDGKVVAVMFEKVRAVYDDKGKRTLVPAGEAPVVMECDDVLMAIGQDNAFPWIERDIGIDFGKWDLPVLDKKTFQSTLPKVFFGGDAAFGPANIITAVAHGHQAAISIDIFCRGKNLSDRPHPAVTLVSQKMNVHEWSYSNDVSGADRFAVPHADRKKTLKDMKMEVELGFDVKAACAEASRCLNCDVQTVFESGRCIECDACADVCPMSAITFAENGAEDDLRGRLNAVSDNRGQTLFVSPALPTGRVLVKDEDVCLHCGLCAERCPTEAWDMKKFLYTAPKTACFKKTETPENEAA